MNIQDVIQSTAEFLDIDPSEVDWITSDALAAMEAAQRLTEDAEVEGLEVLGAGGLDASVQSLSAAPPNRQLYVNGFTYNLFASKGLPGGVYVFRPNCNLTNWWWIPVSQYRSHVRSGACSNGSAGYIHRFVLKWRV